LAVQYGFRAFYEIGLKDIETNIMKKKGGRWPKGGFQKIKKYRTTKKLTGFSESPPH